MAAAGALLGPVLDGFHGRFGVNAYHSPPPFPVEVAGFELCQTAPWVPPLFGVAGALIGTLYVVGDAALNTEPERRAPGAGAVSLGVLLYVLQYFLSAVLLGPRGILGPALTDPGEPQWWVAGASELFLWAYAILHWRVFDGTRVGVLVSVLTAVGGPLIEIFLLNAPWWDLYAYWAPDLLGIPTWIAPVYFCGGPAVGNLARAALTALQPQRAAAAGRSSE